MRRMGAVMMSDISVFENDIVCFLWGLRIFR